MDVGGLEYIRKRQELWRRRRGLELVSSKGEEGDTAHVDGNLFLPLGPEALEEFQSGAGGKPGKM